MGEGERHPDWPRAAHTGDLHEWALERDAEARERGEESDLAKMFDGDAMNA